MTGLEWSQPPPRIELVAAVREGLAELGTSLRIIATNVLALDARIDLVATDPEGRVTLVLVALDEDGLGLVAMALAQRAWLEARLPDWIQLAPQLGLRPEAAPRAVLVAPAFSTAAIAAARAADPDDFDLLRFRCLRRANDSSGTQVLLEPLRISGTRLAAPQTRRAGTPPPAARFRSGLSDSDLDLTADERRGLD